MVSTFRRSGGASIAAYRLLDALQVHSDVTTWEVFRFEQDGRDCLDRAEGSASPGDGPSVPWWLREKFYRNLIEAAKTDRALTIVSSHEPGIDISKIAACREADVVHLHWVSWFLDPVGIRRLHLMGKRIVWTLHDERPFTGGCHYTAGCGGFRQGCESCPQLDASMSWLPGIQLSQTLEQLADVPIQFVAPSRWLGDQARASRLLAEGRGRVEVIPYSLCLDTFRPVASEEERKALRERHGLPLDAVCIVAGSVDWAETRKGGRLLQAALERMGGLHRKASADVEFCLVTYGRAGADVPGGSVRNVGIVDGEEAMADLLKCCDLYVTMTKEDNLPNTVVESLACGVPVVATRVGGIPDMVTDSVNGRLVPRDDIDAMAEVLLASVVDCDARARWGREARLQAERMFQPAKQASAYEALYRSLLNGPLEGGRASGSVRTHSSGAKDAESTGEEENRERGLPMEALHAAMAAWARSELQVEKLGREWKSLKERCAEQKVEIKRYRQELQTIKKSLAYRLCKKLMASMGRLKAAAGMAKGQGDDR